MCFWNVKRVQIFEREIASHASWDEDKKETKFEKEKKETESVEDP